MSGPISSLHSIFQSKCIMYYKTQRICSFFAICIFRYQIPLILATPAVVFTPGDLDELGKINSSAVKAESG